MDKTINKLADIIYKSGLNISELSKKSNISRPMIYKILNKETKNLSSNTIEKLCRACGKTTKDLFEEETPKENTIVVFGRNEGRKEYKVSEKQLKALTTLIETMKDTPDDDNF